MSLQAPTLSVSPESSQPSPGTMAANRTGLQWETCRNLLMAWVLTLPVSIALSASLFWLFSRFV